MSPHLFTLPIILPIRFFLTFSFFFSSSLFFYWVLNTGPSKPALNTTIECKSRGRWREDKSNLDLRSSWLSALLHEAPTATGKIASAPVCSFRLVQPANGSVKEVANLISSWRRTASASLQRLFRLVLLLPFAHWPLCAWAVSTCIGYDVAKENARGNERNSRVPIEAFGAVEVFDARVKHWQSLDSGVPLKAAMAVYTTELK